MFLTFYFVRYERKTSNYLKRKALSYSTHMMSKVDLVAINMETPRINNECYVKKELYKLICMEV